jgi:hypothetical protein
MRKFILTQQHYDLAPGTELDYVSDREVSGRLTLIGLHADGFKVEIPASKVVAHLDNDEFPATKESK